jgi:hypothetical protein
VIRVLLIAGIIVLLLWFLNQHTTTRGQAWSKLATLFLLLFAISTVLSPAIIDKVAHALGVGRGADLLLYGLTLAFLTNLLISYMRHQDEHVKMIGLTRKIAIMEANRDERNQKLITENFGRIYSKK